MQKALFLTSIICLFYSSKVICQNLSLQIYGNNEIENQTIDSIGYLKFHQNYTSIVNEIDSIQNKVYNIGFIESTVSEIQKENDSSFSVKFHLKKKFHTIYIYYGKTGIKTDLIKSVSKKINPLYFELPIPQIERTLTILNTKISNEGFPFSKLSLTNIKTSPNGIIQADLLVNSINQKRHINSITIKGYEKFPKSFLKHYLKIKPDQTFDLTSIKNKAAQLNNLRFAKQIKSPEVLFTNDSTTLYMYIEKSKSNMFDGFLGFGTNEESNKLNFNGYLNLNLVNNLNYGESFGLQYKSTQGDQKFFQADVNMPYLLNTPIGIDLQLYIFKQDSSFSTVNQSVKLNYQINSKHKLFSGIKTSESSNLLNTATTNFISDYKSNFITIAYQFTRPQYYNFLFPVNTTIFLETGFGQRKKTETSEKQTQLNIDAFKIFNFNQKNSFYFRINGSSLVSDSYFENELSRFGGINSIRGFNENSILATSYGFINTEYRLLLSPTIYIHSIIDMASFENKITNTKEKLFAYGFGFGILSKAGLLKLNYANGKISNQKFKLSNSQIHISMTADF
ncbi:MAG TPA: POTRA domain-containing protein [Yeosuana sp.]